MSHLGKKAAITLLPLLTSLFLILPDAAAQPVDDGYLAGYAAAILEREFQSSGHALRVQQGVIRVTVEGMAGETRARLIEALSGIRGVARIEVVEAAAGPGMEPAPTARAQPRFLAERRDEAPSLGWLPPGYLFKPLLADPRWPHFSATYVYYLNDPQLKNVAAVTFGETIPLYRMRGPSAGWLEWGLQAGVFGIFDLDAESMDLINADYFVAAFGAYAKDRFTTLARFFHQSSHLGDEYLLRTREERLNLSYESVDLKLSYELGGGVRAYGGGGVLFDKEPANLRPWSLQGGLEFRSPWTFWEGVIQPIAAVDVRSHQENAWHADLSLRGGVQFNSVQVLGRSLQVLLHYFNGYSPNGQFYKKKIEYVGLGLHFHF